MKKLLALFFLPLLFLACSKKDPVVATIGKNRITLEEYKAAYIEVLKQPNVFDSKDLHEKFLDEMIERRLLANDAKTLGMDKDERFTYRVAANRDKNMREVHYQQVIKPKISFAESDVEKTYAWMNEERHIRHLFSETQAGADSLHQWLQQGAKWEDLARLAFSDTRLAENGGDLGWVSWEQMEYDLAMTAFTLPLKVYSQPVASSYGWHILQVVDWRKTPLLSETDYLYKRRNARAILENKLGDKLALAYIRDMMKNKKIQVYPKTLQRVGAALGSLLQRTPSTADQMRVEQLSENEMGRIETSLWDLRNEPLAMLDDEALTVAQFVAALNYVPYHGVHKSMKTALDYVLRDRALTQEARKMGLDRDPQVRIKTALFAENKMQLARRLSLLADVTVDDTELYTYFEKHIKNSMPNISFAEIREEIRTDALREKRASIMQAHMDSLRQGVKIVKNSTPIHAWYESVLKR